MNHQDEQRIQEEQYAFPYHYIPFNDTDGFRSHVYWSWGINYLSALEFLVGKLAEDPFKKLVDVGCGDGRFVREVNARIEGRATLGVDYSERAIALASALNPGLAFRQVDLFDNDLPDDFDVVTLIEVLEHIPVDRVPAFLDRVSDLQPDGGRLYLTVPHTNRAVQRKHYQHFNLKTLTQLVDARYELREVFFFDRKRRDLKLLRGLMRNRFFILNHTGLLNFLYAFYKKNMFLCAESECSRFGVVAVKRRAAG